MSVHSRHLPLLPTRRSSDLASTQKLLTALIVAESGFLDRAVTVQPTDTMAEPVKLNIKAGDTYQRIDLLRALLVKSPNDVARRSEEHTSELQSNSHHVCRRT